MKKILSLFLLAMIVVLDWEQQRMPTPWKSEVQILWAIV